MNIIMVQLFQAEAPASTNLYLNLQAPPATTTPIRSCSFDPARPRATPPLREFGEPRRRAEGTRAPGVRGLQSASRT
jgi:hypothetical protein